MAREQMADAGESFFFTQKQQRASELLNSLMLKRNRPEMLTNAAP